MSTQYSSDRPRPSQGASKQSRAPALPVRPARGLSAVPRARGPHRPGRAVPSNSGSSRRPGPPQGRRPRRAAGANLGALLRHPRRSRVLIVALILLISSAQRRQGTRPRTSGNSAVPTRPVATGDPGGAASAPAEATRRPDQTTTASSHSDSLAAMPGLGRRLRCQPIERNGTGLSLSINRVSARWMNILLLGSDERKISDSARAPTA